MSKTEIIKAGKHKFTIVRNIQTYNGEIIIHTYKLGGDYPDCVNISYRYKNNKPIQAKIPYLLYEPECALMGVFLEKGSGTELMIKTSIRYAYKDVPSIPIFEFDDDSHIDCIEKNLSKSIPRKQKKPLNLAFFYIAYHDKTWYEARFNAKMIDNEKYKTYRNSLDFLTDPTKKPSFVTFLEIIGESLESSIEKIPYLETYYNKAATYRDFFQNIPKTKRCEILIIWLNSFMNHYIGNTFSDKGWFIDVNKMDTSQHGGNSLSLDKKYRIFSYRNITCF